MRIPSRWKRRFLRRWYANDIANRRSWRVFVRSMARVGDGLIRFLPTLLQFQVLIHQFRQDMRAKELDSE